MIYFDVTKAGGSRHHSGLLRVSSRLRDELGSRAVAVIWRNGWKNSATRQSIVFAGSDWLITPELFCEAERPGFWKFLREKPVRMAAIFHDAIPLKFPHSTWPQSVARHPEYLKMLTCFDRVLAVSNSSREELCEFWKWQGSVPLTKIGRIDLGADLSARPSPASPNTDCVLAKPRLLCIGIIEPRKNQDLLVDVAEKLMAEKIEFKLDFIGRVNPHFGVETERKIRRLSARYSNIRYLGNASDQVVENLWPMARATVFPTLAEGCGLPLLESLARGVPCVCSDLPVLRENGALGGCVFVTPNDRDTWAAALKSVLTDAVFADTLRAEARARTIPTWSQSAAQLLEAL